MKRKPFNPEELVPDFLGLETTPSPYALGYEPSRATIKAPRKAIGPREGALLPPVQKEEAVQITATPLELAQPSFIGPADPVEIIPPNLPTATPLPPAITNPLVQEHMDKVLAEKQEPQRLPSSVDSTPDEVSMFPYLMRTLGAGFLGRDPGAPLAEYQGAQQSAKDRAAKKLEQSRKNKLEDYNFERQQVEDQREDDEFSPDSPTSVAVRAAVADAFPNVKAQVGAGWDKLPAKSFGDLIDVQKVKESLAYKNAMLEAQGGNQQVNKIKLMNDVADRRADNARADREVSLRERELNAKLAPKGPGAKKPSFGQKAMDTAFAKDYNDWLGNGRSSLQKNLSTLRGVRDQLKSSNSGSGRIVGRLPDIIKPESSVQMREDVRAATQGALRAILGGQFTEREAENMMKRSYDETLSPEENVKKLDRAISELESNASEMDQRAQFFDQNEGSLAGYQGASRPTVESQSNSGAGEVERVDKKTGKTAIFDSATKKFKRWK